MVGEGTTAIFITFLLAIIGYVGLTTVVVRSLRHPMPWTLWRGVALVIVVHVAMVWVFRFHGDFSLAVRNGYAGFIMFHAALLIIIVSTLVRERMARRLVQVAFVIVTMGALGASFLYEVVAVYRIPVILCAVVGGGSLLWYYGKQFRARAPGWVSRP
ncbi:MAG TPA: hypothetical protein VKP65_23175 [Rhodothermales bacterium]|nr:hypothetical protein [Rhodothermales bacterium]